MHFRSLGPEADYEEDLPMKRSACILAGVMAIGILAGPVLAWYPSTPQIEFGTATW